ncbi:sugar phosphate isomerase/epimerase family protein [Paraburkholderia tuberum]|uniref:Protein FrlC n=1 Tax=Paraburkholderia tuberum TaxID=157910 RepID=A0A1H1KH70_9BURK|nr:sugar phosphate isomerase/epimerase [Paraburkholderia tuberum]SDR61422.1 protein FrlC [Paraburkholderia tuberum]
MKLSFNTWVYSSFPVWVPSYPLSETIERIAAVGYDGIEIGAAAPHAYPDYLDTARRREIKQMLQTNGIALSSMLPAPGGGPGFNVSSPMVEERIAAIDQYKKVIQLCAELGGKTVIYVAGWQIYGTTRGEAWEWSREALRTLAPVARDVGITLVIEPTSADSNLVDDCDDALQMMREVDEPNVKLMFDTYHVLYRNEVASDYVYRFGKDLHHVHFADSNRLPPGEGKGDFLSVVQALHDIKYDGYIAMEIGYDRRDSNPDAIARRAYKNVKEFLGAIERNGRSS